MKKKVKVAKSKRARVVAFFALSRLAGKVLRVLESERVVH